MFIERYICYEITKLKVLQTNLLLDSDLRNRILNPMMEERNPFTQRNKIRPGLNVFDKEGNELEWDFEHDTRFYDESAADDVEKRATKPSLLQKRCKSKQVLRRSRRVADRWHARR